jgi:UDP-N-acetyl-D-glucosamine dehydrogenase
MSETALLDRVRDRTANLSIVGQGYVGLPLAVEFARAQFRVTGLDTNAERVAELNAGRPQSPDVDPQELRELLQAGCYRASQDFNALEQSDVVIICVPTPLRKSKDPDISFVVAAAEQVAARFRPNQLVVLESTTYPGTTEEILLPMLEARGGRAGTNLFVAFSPERIDPGNPTYRVRDIPKVVGGVTPACGRVAAFLYRQIIAKVVEVSNPKVAELAKLYENVFRNVNIALANEMALVCRRVGVNTREVIDAAATKPFGFLPFYPGPGIGGHCIGIDPIYLAWKMRIDGYETRFIHLADSINRAMPEYVVELVNDAFNRRRRSLNGSRILMLGVAYKRGVGDIRESPALEIISLLRGKGVDVSYADPFVPSVTVDGSSLRSLEVSDEVLQSTDCALIVTDHPQFDYQRIVSLAPLVVDTRGATWGIPAPDARVVAL